MSNHRARRPPQIRLYTGEAVLDGFAGGRRDVHWHRDGARPIASKALVTSHLMKLRGGGAYKGNPSERIAGRA